MTERVECAVIGAGVVGLAVARALALAGREVIVLEAEGQIGTGVSSRNSEVVHAGIYYPPGSLRARFCIPGREALYAYCTERGIGARRIGKVIVAGADAQIETLRRLLANAQACGADDVTLVDAGAVNQLEPDVRCVAGLISPSSGIVDSHAFMLALLGDIEDNGGMIAFGTPVTGGAVIYGGLRLKTGGGSPMEIEARHVVNCAGLGAVALAKSLRGLNPATVPRAYLAKGNYFSLVGVKAPFRHLVYPVPEPGGLGIHATLDLAGQARFGPDVEWIDTLDYAANPARLAAFETAIRAYWPGLPDKALQASYAGVRPKITGPGEAAADFVIRGPVEHDAAGLWNLFGIESPGLTASLAIADYVCASMASA